MADNPLSVALPPSPPCAACFTSTGINDVSINEKTSKIGQEVTEFMSSIDSFDQDSITPCFDSSASPTLPSEEGLHDTCTKDAPLLKMTTKNGSKLTASLMVAVSTSQDNTTLLSAAHFGYGQSPIPLFAACPKDIDIDNVPLTEETTRKGQKLTNFLLDKVPNHSNKITMVSAACFDSGSMPSLDNTASGIYSNIRDASTDRNASKSGQKMMDFTTDDKSTNPTTSSPLSPAPLDIEMDDYSMLAPSHMKRAQSTQNTKKQINIKTFGKGLRRQLYGKKAAPAKQSIPYLSINDIISGKKSFPHLSKNKAETWVMDEEEISILPEQGTSQQLHPSNELAHSYNLTEMKPCRARTRIQPWKDGSQ